jgi:hypothetical protein
MATNESTTYIPPGYRALAAVVAEYGIERVRGWLAEPRIEAIVFNPKTGKEYTFEGVGLWRSDEAPQMLRTGKYRNFVLMVRNFDQPPDFVVQWPDRRENFPPPNVEPAAPPPAPPEPVTSESAPLERSGTATWVAAEIGRMKAAGELSPHIVKSKLAKHLVSRMKAAHAKGTAPAPVGQRHLENNLVAWGLWPL